MTSEARWGGAHPLPVMDVYKRRTRPPLLLPLPLVQTASTTMLRFASSALRSTPVALRRPLSTTTHALSLSFKLNRTQPSPVFPRPLACYTPSSLLRGQLLVRGAASHVSGRPGSQTAAQAARNIREEVGHAGGDLAKAIAGGNVYSDAVAPTQETFVSIYYPSCHGNDGEAGTVANVEA